MATIKDVAKLAGVSTGTVSRVLNKNGYVGAETLEKVNAAIEALNFEPNAVARGLAGKKTSTIMLILPDITNPFNSSLARAVQDQAEKYGNTVILCNSDDNGGKEIAYLELLKKRYIDGVIFASNTIALDAIRFLNKHDIHVVMLDRAYPLDRGYVIRLRNVEGAQTAVRHLLDIGCRKIAHIYGPLESTNGMERMMGYESIARQFDWYSPSLMAPGNYSIEGGMSALSELLERHPDIDGIFAGNDLMAIGALKKMLKMGIKVPDDIALCGFDGINLTLVTEPEITTVAQPIAEIGKIAVDILIGKKPGGIGEDRVVHMDTELIQRSTTTKR